MIYNFGNVPQVFLKFGEALTDAVNASAAVLTALLLILAHLAFKAPNMGYKILGIKVVLVKKAVYFKSLFRRTHGQHTLFRKNHRNDNAVRLL